MNPPHQFLQAGRRVLAAAALLFCGGLSVAVAQQIGIATVPFASDEVMALVYSPDGMLLAGGSRDKTVKVWDMRTNTLLHALEGPRALVRCVAISRDGKTVAADAGDGSICYWDVTTGKLTQAVEAHEGLLMTLAYAPDGTLLASGGSRPMGGDSSKWSTAVKLWDARTGAFKRTVLQRQGHISSVAFSPDGKLLAMALRMAAQGNEQSFAGVKLWNLETATESESLVLDRGFPQKIAFSPDGTFLASSCGYTIAVDRGARIFGEVKMWDLATGRLRWTTPSNKDGYYRSVAFSPDGKQLTSACAGDSRGTTVCQTKLWETATGRLLWNAENDGGEALDTAFSPDGQGIVTTNSSGVFLSDAQTGMRREVLMKVTRKKLEK